MLYVDRNRVKPNKSLIRIFQRYTEEAAKPFFDREDRNQERFEFNSEIWMRSRSYLEELFDETCAFCESPISLATGSVDHFRPKTEACNLDNQADPDWYWWLAYEWENLYLVCHSCSLNKKNYFPVIGERVNKAAKGDVLRKEKSLLLDPCIDDPARHLHFLDDGIVESISLYDSSEKNIYEGMDRGQTTIDVLALNRSDLLSQRRAVAQNVIDVLNLIRHHGNKEVSDSSDPGAPPSLNILTRELLKLINEFGSFVAVKRQVIARWLIKDKKLLQLLEQNKSNDLNSLKEIIEVELEVQKLLTRQARPLQVTEEANREAKISPSEEIKYENAYIRSIEIHNFRAIRNLKIRINEWGELVSTNREVNPNPEINKPASIERRVGWKMLLGENGAGKSSFLKAIALGLMGEKYYNENKKELRLTPPQIFNSKTKDKEGLILIELSKGERIEIHFTKDVLEFISGKTGGANVYVRGYGAARLFSRTSHRADRMGDDEPLKDVENLFYPEILLANPDKWLATLNKTDFDSTAISLGDLLNLSSKNPLTKIGDEVYLDSGNGPQPLAEQSDGYNSILALLVDILAGLPKTLRDKREATGIILLDEIDSHLHPRWKMRIVSNLQKTFPNMQFIATTHEPLCLQGLGAGEITIMKRDGDKFTVMDDTPSTVGLRVDQLLTSELFGLESTIDPDIEDKFYKYYSLLAEARPSDKELAEKHDDLIAKLKHELQSYNVLGFTRRDRLVYEIIDDYLVREKPLSDKVEIASLKQSTKEKVFELWDMVKTRREKLS